MKKFSELNISGGDNLIGDKIKIEKILNREIIVTKFRIETSKYPKNKTGQCLYLQLELNGGKNVVFSGSDVLINQIQQVSEGDVPFTTTIIKSGEHYEFT